MSEVNPFEPPKAELEGKERPRRDWFVTIVFWVLTFCFVVGAVSILAFLWAVMHGTRFPR